MVARQIMNGNGIPGNATWSGLLGNSALASGGWPLPILLSTGRTFADGKDAYTPNGTIYETTPYEFGSWDPVNIGAFISTNELGTAFIDGSANGTCYSGFDNAA